jgi:predicted ABC-type ATPase
VTDSRETPCIYVLAGTNGAGKSRLVGSLFPDRNYFNPDEIAASLRSLDPKLSQEHANSQAWHEGQRLLETAINGFEQFAFETTLGGNSVTSRLEKALSLGLEVRVLYIGLDSPERHIARVRARVKRGLHDIPEEQIRARYDKSRQNLIRLLPYLTELRVYDNSEEADPDTGAVPVPKLLLHMERGKIVDSYDRDHIPDWARPILDAALQD